MGNEEALERCSKNPSFLDLAGAMLQDGMENGSERQPSLLEQLL